MLAHGLQHGQRVVDGNREFASARGSVAPVQFADAVARGTANVGDSLRGYLYQIEPGRHASAHFAGKDGG